MAGGELAGRPRGRGLFELVDLAGDTHAPVGVTAGAARVGDEERGRGSGAVRGPLTRPVELAQPTSDFGIEASAGPFQREEIVAEGPEPQVGRGELVDRFVQTLDRRIHPQILHEHTFDNQALRAEKPRKNRRESCQREQSDGAARFAMLSTAWGEISPAVRMVRSRFSARARRGLVTS